MSKTPRTLAILFAALAVTAGVTWAATLPFAVVGIESTPLGTTITSQTCPGVEGLRVDAFAYCDGIPVYLGGYPVDALTGTASVYLHPQISHYRLVLRRIESCDCMAELEGYLEHD